MYFETLLAHIGHARLGAAAYKKVERKTYEEKLRLLGVTDVDILARCKHFREARNDLMHEKVMRAEELSATDFRFAQAEAACGVEFMQAVGQHLSSIP